MKRILKKLGIDNFKEFFGVLLVLLGTITMVGAILYICYSLHWLLGLLLTGFLFFIAGIGIIELYEDNS